MAATRKQSVRQDEVLQQFAEKAESDCDRMERLRRTQQRTDEAERRKEVAELAADFARLIVSVAGGFPVIDGDREFAIRTCVAQARAFYDEVYRPTSKPGQGRRTGTRSGGKKAKGSEAEEMGVGDDYAEFFDERYDDGEE